MHSKLQDTQKYKESNKQNKYIAIKKAKSLECIMQLTLSCKEYPQTKRGGLCILHPLLSSFIYQISGHRPGMVVGGVG